MYLRTPFVAALFSSFAACATTATAPSERAERSAAAIVAAEAGGAADNVQADLYLRLAKDEFAYSQRLPNSSDQDRVDRLLRRALADAELSLALARNEEQKIVLRGAIEDGKALNRRAKDSERSANEGEPAAKQGERTADQIQSQATGKD
jgi:hypothetical protein